nr:phosphatidate cytidylyltransferase [uncultured Porphyromonas sp.]
MALDKKNLLIRSLSGLVYVALIVSSLLWENPLLRILLFSFFTGAMIVEYNLLTKVNRLHPFRTTLDVIASVCAVLSPYCFLKPDLYLVGVALIFFYLFYIFYIVARTIFSDLEKGAVRSIGNVLVGQLYITLPMVLTSLFSYPMGGTVILFLFVILWVNDTGAYLVGSLFGKHKLYPAVSPKKSVEGLIGGLALSILVGALFGYFSTEMADCYFGSFGFSPLSDIIVGGGDRLMEALSRAIFSLLIVVLGTLGDLFESVLKRQAKVKDSGNIIPGHGGVLDRLDSYLFASYILLFFSLSSLFVLF